MTSEAPAQPAHPRSLIRVYTVLCLFRGLSLLLLEIGLESDRTLQLFDGHCHSGSRLVRIGSFSTAGGLTCSTVACGCRAGVLCVRAVPLINM